VWFLSWKDFKLNPEVAQDAERSLMLSISIKHPDSGKFIDAKLESGKVTGAMSL